MPPEAQSLPMDETEKMNSGHTVDAPTQALDAGELSRRVEAAEAGSERQRARSLACVHALKSALSFALERKEVCERARDRLKTEKPDEPYWHMSEQCAAHEARHIADKLAELLKEVGTGWTLSDEAKAEIEAQRQAQIAGAIATAKDPPILRSAAPPAPSASEVDALVEA